MSKKSLIIGGVLLAAVGSWAVFFRNKEEVPEIEYRYAPVAKGELVRSITATGQLVALTTVDVKSKAGGKVVRLAVDEGTFVRKGDLIAEIDPEDTRASYDQAFADLSSAQARAAQAQHNFRLQVANSRTSVADAEAALETAQIRLERMELMAKRQPELTSAALKSAEADTNSAMTELERIRRVAVPRMREDVRGDFERSKQELAAAEADLKRQEELLAKGYVAQAVVDRARSTAQSARAAFASADARRSTVENEIRAMEQSAASQAERAQASLQQARANASQDQITQKDLADARKAVEVARIDVERARAGRINNDIRRNEVQAAQAATVRSRVSVKNAKVQLESTTVVAPRDGVVTMKYLEEGTIIPPGTSTFAQGTSLVQLSDVTKMYVECAVDEADIGNVRQGQRVRIVTEAFPGQSIEGLVQRVNPAATTANNITAVKVRIEVLPGSKVQLLPGMNATCEFITLSKPDVLLVPQQAIDREDGKTFVRIKGPDPLRPVRREVEIGEFGNEGAHVISGLSEGDEVVVAEIDLKLMRETQEKMLEAMQGGGGGLAGGAPRRQGSMLNRGAGGAGGAGGGGARSGGGGR